MGDEVGRKGELRGPGQPRRIERRRMATVASTIRIAALAAGIVTAMVFFAFPAGAQRSTEPARDPIYLDKSYTFAERAADLVARLTPTQRASQLVSSQAPAIPTAANPLLTDRFGGQTALGAPALDLGTGITFTPALTGAHAFGVPVNMIVGVPAYGWWNEALHGINAESLNSSGNAVTLTNTTSYPIDLSRAASWDPALTYEVAKAESDEAREIVRSNKFDLDFYSPTINLGRDPRWGRNDESYGEDPLLEADVASQFVNGMEGKNENGQLLPEGDGFYKATTTLKHYALNNTEGTSNSDPNGRLNGSSDTDDRSIREYYTMPFRKIVQSSQNGAIMSSYNEINGVPSAANAYLNDTLMRETFGFQGYFTGDCDAVNQINTRHHWQPAGFPHIATVVEQFAFTLGSGEDAECNAGYNGSGSYRGPTSPSTSQGGLMNAIGMHIPTPTGETTVNDLDVSATRLFTNRMKLGEFNPDSTVPWLTQARDRVKSYGVYPWVSSSANNAETETPDRLALGPRSTT